MEFQKLMALELLVRQGNVDAVKDFAVSEGLTSSVKEEKSAEAGIYNALTCMENDCGIDDDRIVTFLNQERFTNYLASSTNLLLMDELIEVLHQSGLHACMEAYAQIGAVAVMGMPSIASFVRRNLDAPGIREKMSKFAHDGYRVVFSTHDIDPDQVEKYFPLVDIWRDLVDTKKLVAEVLDNFDDFFENLEDYDNSYRRSRLEFLDMVLEKTIQLTDRTYVSQIMNDKYSDNAHYQKLLQDGKLDPSQKTQSSPKSELQKMVEEYGRKDSGYIWDVRKFGPLVQTKEDLEYLSTCMGEWLGKGKAKHVLEVVNYEKDQDGNKGKLIYDKDLARKEISDNLARLSVLKSFDILGEALKLPEDLIDRNNPDISGFVQAYDLTKKHNPEE